MTINLYAIDRDNGNGRYVRRLAFVPFAGPVNYTDDRGRVIHQDTDGGLAAEIMVPEGSRMVGGRLVLADGIALTADDVLAAARDRPWRSYGLRLVANA